MKARTLIAVVAASATFGGVVGAALTAATESQASPAAIAAAVQRVQDTKAEATLQTVAADLKVLDGTLSNAYGTTLYDIEQNLASICRNTETPGVIAFCAPQTG